MWIRKHRDIIPAVFVSFYELKSEERPENLSDEELGRHLAELKYLLINTTVVAHVIENPLPTEVLNYVLFSPVHGNVSPFYPCINHLLVAEDISNRLDYLRRNASLDSKTGLFYLPPPTHKDSLAEFFKT
jgi:hypothetical protein